MLRQGSKSRPQQQPGQIPAECKEGLPELPPVNSACWTPKGIPGTIEDPNVQYVDLPPENQVVTNEDHDHHQAEVLKKKYVQYNKTLNVLVNRNHVHNLEVKQNTNIYNTYNINKVYKVRDIHHQRVNYVPGETRCINHCNESITVEPAECVVVDGTSYISDQCIEPAPTPRPRSPPSLNESFSQRVASFARNIKKS